MPDPRKRTDSAKDWLKVFTARKYRIIQRERGHDIYYYPEVKRWWLPFWQGLGARVSLRFAQQAIQCHKCPVVHQE